MASILDVPRSREEITLSRCITDLTKSLMFDDIKDILVRDEVIFLDHKDIIEEVVGESNRISKLVSLLARTDLTRTFPLFLDALDEVGRHDVRVKLETQYGRLYKIYSTQFLLSMPSP